MAGEATPGDQTRAYYEEEASRGVRKPQYGRNLELRTETVERFVGEGRKWVLDVGAGPGLDGPAFAAAGISYLGIDVAVGNARTARQSGVTVVPGSATHLPFVAASFDAAWSMSTYMHLDAEAMGKATADLARVLQPGATGVISLWGGDRHVTGHNNIEGRTRHYFLRPVEHNTEILEVDFTIESCRVWPDDHGLGWDQQVFVLHPRTDVILGKAVV